MDYTVDIADMKVVTSRDDVLVTYSLGSCVGLVLYDPEAQIAGMIHCMLPMSKIDKEKAAKKPCMFVDTGIPHMLQEIFDLGARRERLIAKVAGAASPLDDKQMFRIGQRNYAVLRKILWKNDILIAAEEIGGSIPRTLYHFMETGKTEIRSRGQRREL